MKESREVPTIALTGNDTDTILKRILKHNDLGSSTGTFNTSASVLQYGKNNWVLPLTADCKSVGIVL
jgi:hypothetical protein